MRHDLRKCMTHNTLHGDRETCPKCAAVERERMHAADRYLATDTPRPAEPSRIQNRPVTQRDDSHKYSVYKDLHKPLPLPTHCDVPIFPEGEWRLSCSAARPKLESLPTRYKDIVDELWLRLSSLEFAVFKPGPTSSSLELTFSYGPCLAYATIVGSFTTHDVGAISVTVRDYRNNVSTHTFCVAE